MQTMRLDADHASPHGSSGYQRSDGYPENTVPTSHSQHFEQPLHVHSNAQEDNIEDEGTYYTRGVQYDQHDQAIQQQHDNAVTGLHLPLQQEYDYEATVPYRHNQHYGQYSQSPALAHQYQQSPDRSAPGAAQSGASGPGIGHQYAVQRTNNTEAARPQYRQQSRSFVPQQNQPETEEESLQQRAGWLSNFWRR